MLLLWQAVIETPAGNRRLQRCVNVALVGYTLHEHEKTLCQKKKKRKTQFRVKESKTASSAQLKTSAQPSVTYRPVHLSILLWGKIKAGRFLSFTLHRRSSCAKRIKFGRSEMVIFHTPGHTLQFKHLCLKGLRDFPVPSHCCLIWANTLVC